MNEQNIPENTFKYMHKLYILSQNITYIIKYTERQKLKHDKMKLNKF